MSKINKLTKGSTITEHINNLNNLINKINDLLYTIDKYSKVTTTGKFSDLLEIPEEFNPKAHTHLTTDITDLKIPSNINELLGYDKLALKSELPTDYLSSSLKGVANGLAELDITGKIPASQLPSYVDDVIEGYFISDTEFNDINDKAVTIESGKIYADIDTNYIYRWTGTKLRRITGNLVLGETSSTAFRGDYGRIAYDHTNSIHAPTDANKNVQVDWNEEDSTLDAYIKNKPILSKVAKTNKYSDLDGLPDIPTVTNDLTDSLKVKYDTAYNHSQSAHTPSTVATTSANGLMSSTDKTNVDANTTARHTHSNKSVLDGITADSLSKYAKTSGGNTFTGIQHVAGTAADKPFWVRGIQGCMSDGITEGELHLNYQSNHPVKWGYNANGTLNSDGGATFAGDITVGKVTIFNENNGSIEIGDRTGTYSTPYIDFHTNTIDTDYDVRIVAKNENIGTTSTGQGYLEIQAKKLLITGSIYQNGKSLLDSIYPVGTIYMSVSSTSPASLFGGTWYALQDRFLLGAGSYSNGSTGGSATHTLTTNEMPSHNHKGLYWQQSSYGVSLDGNGGSIYMNHVWTGSTNTTNLFTGHSGGGSAHNNMPPYLVVYMWKRTA